MEITSLSELEEALGQTPCVVLDCHDSTCSPATRAPQLVEAMLPEDFPDVRMLTLDAGNADAHLLETVHVFAWPTIVFYKNGVTMAKLALPTATYSGGAEDGDESTGEIVANAVALVRDTFTKLLSQ